VRKEGGRVIIEKINENDAVDRTTWSFTEGYRPKERNEVIRKSLGVACIRGPTDKLLGARL